MTIARLTLALLLAAACTASAQAPDISGTWKRNPKLSQDQQERILAAAGPESADRGDRQREAFRRNLQHLAGGFETMEIEQGPSEVKAVVGEDNVRIFYLRRSHVRETPLGFKLQVSSRWSEGQLVVTQTGEQGIKPTETFALEAGGKQLAHSIRVESELLREPLEVRSVYDRAPR